MQLKSIFLLAATMLAAVQANVVIKPYKACKGIATFVNTKMCRDAGGVEGQYNACCIPADREARYKATCKKRGGSYGDGNETGKCEGPQ
ncbi:unnamed protein product [Zymoseptoria tritici ST99CH_1A5]|uniref:Uncharacterized protein n=3 Tax=Zymoseptoria tritici TaxID=1047171 RepID=A0A1X7RZV3_ZYMT9|nr:unnamed protein product [Zymoseptoria tritici ST99CH_3D7]SMR55301.1 unnamed protein product [Zymoseptoria tritici ST99CH_1E4]SMR57676.1 unnamed protein product [Zymoseptoria tritici ST99CH_3D1]SMY26113.1 unnamed protein product [Zymoseptoria tritici ST99CH_1A5]